MPHKILAVDDDPKVLKILNHTLTREGFLVSCASNGFEALETARENKPDLVLLDVMMPGMDGFETLRKLKEFLDVPVIILSARGDEIDRVVGFRMGVDDYQVKPFSPMELSLRVKAVLRRSAVSDVKDKKVLQYSQIVIDYNKRIVQNGERTITLTPKEFELLWLMASHPNQVFTKAHLLEVIWESTYEGDENTVNVHIRRLREKIEDIPSKPVYIKTVWGTGYKFEHQ
ncbi:two component transcriptional regulator, winged helix family [Desulfotomaculum arcticum]|uniref:Stage 0 sporulation protein A homolog n=1 Tax=Desulfotruncus arcticus DSM 17038 TaxID=1121424 RepID=A0A1I2XFQ8_9FIRM|nr:response regulator transcription factor [Desulfotruncus arcticus]SFH11887.1 two component transcriptional regulator, winged helix family [Desulfotomaculum arcticum] [Desulfotruncus arcticus DSM 17038]